MQQGKEYSWNLLHFSCGTWQNNFFQQINTMCPKHPLSDMRWWFCTAICISLGRWMTWQVLWFKCPFFFWNTGFKSSIQECEDMFMHMWAVLEKTAVTNPTAAFLWKSLRLIALPKLPWQYRIKEFTTNVSTEHKNILNHPFLAFLWIVYEDFNIWLCWHTHVSIVGLYDLWTLNLCSATIFFFHLQVCRAVDWWYHNCSVFVFPFHTCKPILPNWPITFTCL